MAFSRTIRVLLVDEHELVALSLQIAFDVIDDIELIGRAVNGAEAVDMVPTLNPDVVLMDLRMPVMDGFQATAIIRERHPHVKIVVLSASNMQSDIDDAIQAGADAYLNKNRDNGDSIVRTIRSVIR